MSLESWIIYIDCTHTILHTEMVFTGISSVMWKVFIFILNVIYLLAQLVMSFLITHPLAIMWIDTNFTCQLLCTNQIYMSIPFALRWPQFLPIRMLIKINVPQLISEIQGARMTFQDNL